MFSKSLQTFAHYADIDQNIKKQQHYFHLFFYVELSYTCQIQDIHLPVGHLFF